MIKELFVRISNAKQNLYRSDLCWSGILTRFQIELAMTPVIIGSNEGETLKHGKCSTEGGYEKYKDTVLIGPPVGEELGNICVCVWMKRVCILTNVHMFVCVCIMFMASSTNEKMLIICESLHCRCFRWNEEESKARSCPLFIV